MTYPISIQIIDFKLLRKKCRAKRGKIAQQAKKNLTLAKCFTDLAKLFSINCELDFINIAMLFSFSLNSDNCFYLARHP